MDNLKDSTGGIFGEGVGRMITVVEWLLRESDKGEKVVMVDPQEEYEDLIKELPKELINNPIDL